MRKPFVIILSCLMLVFLYVVAGMQFIDQSYSGNLQPLFFFLPFLIFFALSIVLIVFTFKKKVTGKLKKFLLLTGISPLVMVVSIVLHNLVYAVFILVFGEGFWERVGMGDEPVFFLLAVIVCPIAFLVGLIGSTILLIRKKE